VNINSNVSPATAETPLLIPLTTSLYVPGTLSAPSNNTSSSQATLLVDIGTGFYLEKTPQEATKFYTGKVDDLQKNLTDIEKLVGNKTESLRMVEDVLRRKMIEEQPEQFGPGGGGGQGVRAGR
jgi:prefoldin alpha subunit